MKRFVLLVVMPLAFLSASFGQITRDASDFIVLERMSKESRPHTVYAKTDTAAIATKAGELLELDYSCWIYYIHYCDQAEDSLAARRYLVVKESSGNVLEVRTKNDTKPYNLDIWKPIGKEISIVEYPLNSNVCQWQNFQSDTLFIINSAEELENYLTCTNGNYPAIDFTKNSLLLAHGYADNVISAVNKNIEQKYTLDYQLNIDIYLNDSITVVPQEWHVAVVVPKPCQNAIALNVQQSFCAKVLMLIVDQITNTFLEGKEFVFPVNSDSFTIAKEYRPPNDFGYIKFYYKEMNEMLFYGTMIHQGEGQMIFPDSLLDSTHFQRVVTNDTVMPQNGFEDIFQPPFPPIIILQDTVFLPPFDTPPIPDSVFTYVWNSVQTLVKVREYLQSNPEQTVKIFAYAPSVMDYYDYWRWIIYLKQ